MIDNRIDKKRDSNLELFRIITMLLIVAHHFVVNSGLTASDGPVYASPMTGKSLFLLLFGAWGKTGINCFVLITGYFMCKSQITLKKFIKLICEFMFYRLIFYLIFLVSGYAPFSVITLVRTVIPITQINQNFTSCFILFWLFIPFLNVLIKNINEKQHIRLILLSVFLYIILGTIKQVTMNYVSWFVVLYFISSYIRLYPKKTFAKTKLWGALTLISIVVAACSVVACTWVFAKYGKLNSYAFVTDSNTLLAVIVGICSFLFFKNLRIKHNILINVVAASTFGVLCIHANSDTMRQWLWKDLLDVVGHYDSNLMPLYAIGSVLAIFAVCVVIDILRIKLIEKPLLRWWDKHEKGLVDWFKRIESKIFNKFNIG